LRRIRYRVAMSLDGFIAGPNGETDWIVPDPDADFAAVYAGFDSVILGRRTFALTQQPGAPPWPAGWKIFVVSRTLRPADYLSVSIVADDVRTTVSRLRAAPGSDIWLFGGGVLASSLLCMDLVDAVELAIMPVMLGAGVPLTGQAAGRVPLRLARVQHSSAGIVNLQYDVVRRDLARAERPE
jgi:dihydrofolate reductase